MTPTTLLLAWIGAAVLVLIIATALTESEYGFTAFALITAYVLAAHFCGWIDAWTWIKEHPGQILLGLLIYVLAGGAWGLFKWWRFCHKLLRRYTVFARDWPSLTKKEVIEKWANDNWRDRKIPPEADDYRVRITNWIALWPLSVIGMLFGDFLDEFFRMVYEHLAGLLQRISNSVFSGIE